MADTNAEQPAPAQETAPSKAQLEDLIAQATAKYAVKDYREAAELYSRSTELQSELNGEMSPDNADILFLYGRCLYHVAVLNSDVLGGKVAGEKTDTKAGASSSKPSNGEPSKATVPAGEEQTKTEGLLSAVAEEKSKTMDAAGNKPFFQFTGDENFVDSDEEEEAEGDGDEEPEDDFHNAFEVLDLARVLLERKIKQLEEEGGKNKEGSSTEINRVRERLGDTHDLQAEISLENEDFPNAATDLATALKIKKSLFPPESSILAEAHYKLSLALEFSSVTQQKDEEGNVKEGQVANVDEAMREEAAKEMENAIASCKMRIEKEEGFLKDPDSEQARKSKATRETIDDVKDMVKDMEQRLVELRQPPVSINDPTGTGALDGATPLQGILGSILGESPEAQKARLEEASKEAKDLTGLVKRKKQATPALDNTDAMSIASSVTGKRKADDEATPDAESKKAKVEDAAEE